MILERITIMKTRIFIIAILSVLAGVVNGQTFQPAAVDNNAIQSQQILQTSTRYNGHVYEPFSSATPSELSKVGNGSTTEDKQPGGHIRTFINPNDPGNQSNEFPIGEPWVMALLALVYGVWCIVYRRRKNR